MPPVKKGKKKRAKTFRDELGTFFDSELTEDVVKKTSKEVNMSIELLTTLHGKYQKRLKRREKVLKPKEVKKGKVPEGEELFAEYPTEHDTETGFTFQDIPTPKVEDLAAIEAAEEEDRSKWEDFWTRTVLARPFFELALDVPLGGKIKYVPMMEKADLLQMILKLDHSDSDIIENIAKGYITGLSITDVMNARGLSSKGLDRDRAVSLIQLDQMISKGVDSQTAKKRLKKTQWDINALKKAKLEYLYEQKQKLLKDEKPKKKPKKKKTKKELSEFRRQQKKEWWAKQKGVKDVTKTEEKAVEETPVTETSG